MGVFEHNYDFFMTVKFWSLGARVVYHPEPLKLYDFIDEWKVRLLAIYFVCLFYPCLVYLVDENGPNFHIDMAN